MPVIMTVEIIKGLMLLFTSIQPNDYTSYMQQANKISSGEMDYSKVTGESGPIAYPALHSYIYLFLELFWVNNGDMHTLLVKMMAFLAHITTVYYAVRIYQEAFKKDPKQANILVLIMFSFTVTCLSLDHLFNDTFATMFNTIAIYNFVKGKNLTGVVLVALAFNIKMNAILILPAVYLVTSKSQGICIGTLYLFLVVLIQIILGIPYLINYPRPYLDASYNFGRRFSKSVIINWRVLPDEILLSTLFASTMTVCHFIVLAYMLFTRWIKSIPEGFKEISLYPFNPIPQFKSLDTYHVTEIFFLCNFTGIVFIRGLHTQFILWFWYSIPFLLRNGLKSKYNFGIFGYLMIFNVLSYSYSSGRNDFTTILIQPMHFWIMYLNLANSKDSLQETHYESVESSRSSSPT